MTKGYRKLTQAEINQRLLDAKKGIQGVQGGLETYLGYDDTDHIAFFCGKCFGVMDVAKVETTKHAVYTDGTKDNCTYIDLYCPQCKRADSRKFYWIVEDGCFYHIGRPKEATDIIHQKFEKGEIR